MFSIALLFAAWVDAQIPDLGHDEWRVREAATRRLDNPLAALFVPPAAEDPEVNYRLRQIRGRNLKWLSPVYVERRVFRAAPDEWLRRYLFAGRSAIAGEWGTFEAIHANFDLAKALFREWPVVRGESEGFLLGAIYPGEYERWLAHLDYHHGRIPAPHEK